MSNKPEYPKGIYANRYENTPSFVKAKIKIDRESAMAWLAGRQEKLIYLEVCDSQEPDQYGNMVYIKVDDYKRNKESIAAKDGMAQAQRIAQQPKKEIPEDDIPF
jgi:hypothetical protein